MLSFAHFSHASFASLISAALRTTWAVFIQARRAALAASISAWLVVLPSVARMGAGGAGGSGATRPIVGGGAAGGLGLVPATRDAAETSL